ncbi:BQ2448_5617 [Microbotryum intermedium]|uniref:Conserved oligomeric Golgi complex subunit 1 n=1 Tax=Microbotryum intermedium TaxID=269621 RepID=A0A238F4N2_9BASI|nr:BQ2448_5617 [Microbotryum intermedium]
MTTPTTRTRGTSNASVQSLSSAAPLDIAAPIASTSGSPPRRRPPPALSRTNSSLADSPNSRYGSKYGDAASIQALSPRYLTFSSAASNVGSVATSAAPGGPTRFKRGHVRKKAPAIIGIRSANPDEIDFMALEDPDEVFRRFGVRDVRGLEKRASEAAAGKVAELRTMVGERYRDLLSAADSIIRMRAAAEKLVDRFDKVETGISVGEDGNGPDNTPTKRVKHPKLAHRTSLSLTKPDRTFASPPTLSLSIQLLLTLPSTVHGLLESGDFLPAARLEGLGRLIYRALSDFTSDDDDSDGGIKAAFPIIEKQSEAINGLGPSITRRAIAELRTWDTPTLATANTLAAIVMLENASLPSSLATLLEARSKTLSAILHATGSSSKSPDVDTILKRLNEALGVVLRTLDAASSIFGATSSPSSSSSLLAQLLQEIEQPTGLIKPTNPANPNNNEDQMPRLVPIIHTLPNHALLARHLPLSILEYTPTLPMSPSHIPFDHSAAHSQVQSWLALETERVVQGVTSWIGHLRGGARTLAQIRSTLRSSLEAFSGLRDAQADVATLKVSLNAALETRFEEVYRQHMRSLVDRVEPALSSALEKLPTSLADLDTAEFLLETPLPFPKTSYYGILPHMSSRGSNGVASLSAHSFSDTPFEAFLDQVNKRVIGRSPLIDRALSELEAHARELRKDLQDWLESEDYGLDVQYVLGGRGPKLLRDILLTLAHAFHRLLRTRLRIAYVGSARGMLHSVYEALATVLDKHVSSVTSSLFLGNVLHQLSLSTTFTADLLHGTLPVARSQESSIIAEWQSQLAELQKRSLKTWRAQAVERAAEKLRDATSSDALRTAALKARESVQAQQNGLQGTASLAPLPTQPSPAVLSALRNLVSLVRKVGLHRTQTDPTIVRILLNEVAEGALGSYEAFVAKMPQDDTPSQAREFANQVLWDVSFLRRIWSPSQPGWAAVDQDLRQLADPSLVSSVDASTLNYLQRTQTILSSLLPSANTPSSSTSTTAAAVATASAVGWLPLGAVSAPSLALTGLGKPGARMGQLPTGN